MEKFGDILIYIISAVIFYFIGEYAKKTKKPMHFWSGDSIDPNNIKDIYEYNRANARMWKQYALSFLICSLVVYIYPKLSIILFIINLFVGMVIMVMQYEKITKQYMYDPKNYVIQSRKK